MKLRSVITGLASGLAAVCVTSARAQDENPTTPGAIPNPGTYQGSMELQRRSDEQDQQFRQQQQQQYQQPQYGPRYRSQPNVRGRSSSSDARSRIEGYESRDRPLAQAFGRKSAGELAAEAAVQRGDLPGAARLFRPLAAAGDVNAAYNLAVMYEKGYGVPRNTAMAVSLYQKAASRGMPTAMVNLGTLLAISARTPSDLVPAYKWLTVAAHTDDQKQRANAIYNRNMFVRLMTPGQIALAESQARAWRAR